MIIQPNGAPPQQHDPPPDVIPRQVSPTRVDLFAVFHDSPPMRVGYVTWSESDKSPDDAKGWRYTLEIPAPYAHPEGFRYLDEAVRAGQIRLGFHLSIRKTLTHGGLSGRAS